jgi:hypothetical protein
MLISIAKFSVVCVTYASYASYVSYAGCDAGQGDVGCWIGGCSVFIAMIFFILVTVAISIFGCSMLWFISSNAYICVSLILGSISILVLAIDLPQYYLSHSLNPHSLSPSQKLFAKTDPSPPSHSPAQPSHSITTPTCP